MDELKEGTPQFEKRTEELFRNQALFNAWQKIEQARLLRWHFQETKLLFVEIFTAAQQVAKRKGFDVVLVREPDSIQATNAKALVEEVMNRKVLYSHQSMDITKDVMAQVNLSFRTADGK